MVVERMDKIGSLKTFITDHQDEKIVIKNLLENDFSKMQNVITACAEIDDFLQIEIGKDFFYICKTRYKSGSVNYCLTCRTLEKVIAEEV